jgi:hypothetical protein
MDEKLAIESRKEHLFTSIQECQRRFNSKQEYFKSRRHSIAKVEQGDYDTLPSIKKSNPYEVNLLPDIS